MRFEAIHQVLPNLTAEDAIGEYALLLQRIWQGWGAESQIYTERTNLSSASALPLHRLPARMPSTHALVYHHSIGSHAAARFAQVQGAVRVLAYHNVTPPSLLAGVPYLAARANQGLAQLDQLAQVTDLALADSEFNRRDLVRSGYPRTAVVHLSLSSERRAGLQAARRQRFLSPGGKRLLHVGRVIPHKALEELLRCFAIFQKSSDPPHKASLHIVGDTTEAPDYAAYLRELVDEHAIKGVYFAGRVPANQLFQEFAEADLYLCTSRHEGFCVPLVECMYAGVPVLAVSAGAIDEVAGGAAVVVPERDPYVLAELCHILLEDATVRAQVLEAQDARTGRYVEAALEERLKEVFNSLAAKGGHSGSGGAPGAKPLQT